MKLSILQPRFKCPYCFTELKEGEFRKYELIGEHATDPNGDRPERVTYICSCADSAGMYWNIEGDVYARVIEPVEPLEAVKISSNDDELVLLRKVYSNALGLCHGSDWNKGTHAEKYREKLRKAVCDVADYRSGYVVEI